MLTLQIRCIGNNMSFYMMNLKCTKFLVIDRLLQRKWHFWDLPIMWKRNAIANVNFE